MKNIIKQLISNVFAAVIIAGGLLLVQVQPSLAQTGSELVTRAKASIEKRDFVSAVADLDAAIKLDPNSSEAFLHRAHAFSLQKDFQKALADVNESIRLDPQNYLALGLRGDISYRQKNLDAAIADYSKAIEINPKYQTGYYNRGLANKNRPTPDWTAALADFSKAIELNPREADAYDERAYASMKLENWAQAESDYTQAANLGSNDAQRFANLSVANNVLNHFVQAVVNARQALELDPANATAKKNFDYALAKRQKPFDQNLGLELVNAATSNDTGKAIDALNRGADVNTNFSYYNIAQSTPLQRAAFNGNYFLAKALLSLGANPNAQDVNGNSALQFVSVHQDNSANRVGILNLLLKNGADINLPDANGSTPLAGAALWGYDEMVENFVKAGAKVNTRDKVGVTPLITAIRSGTNRSVALLLAAGSDPNAADAVNNFPPLIWAIRKGGFGLMKIYFLLKAGATADLSTDEKFKDSGEAAAFAKYIKSLPADSVETKLFDAAVNGDSPELARLLSATPSINNAILNYLLMISVLQDNPAMLRALLAKGADPNFKIGDSSVLTVAKLGHKDAAAAYLSNYSVDDLRVSAAANNNKVADLINSASQLMQLGQRNMTAAYRRRDEGADKRTWCLRVNDAANDVNAAIKYLKQAEAIASLTDQPAIKDLKAGAADALKSVSDLGCPVFLTQ